MTSEKLNRAVQSELALLVSQEMLTFEQSARIAERYPAGQWNVASLARWFTILGAVAAGVGILLLAPEVMSTKGLIDGGLALGAIGSISAARWLFLSRNMPKTAATLELLGSFSLQGLTFALAIQYSTGSKNWPLLVGIGCMLATLLAYILSNRLVLIHATVNFFIWFGGETGYDSGWGAYWLGMDYPLRFLAAGVVTLGFAFLHYRFATGAWQGFSRVYAHFGILIINLALWFFSVFGYFEGKYDWTGTTGQRIAFTALWAAVSIGSIFAASGTGLRLFRSYGATFLTINAYTFYFQFVAYKSPEMWWMHLLIIGGSLFAGGFWLEQRRRAPVA